MNNHSLTDYKKQPLLKRIINVVAKAVIAGLLLVFGFWLLIMSNMGPAYLPNVCNGCLDMWIRMTLLVIGLSLWILTAIWCVWHVCHWGYDWIKRYS